MSRYDKFFGGERGAADRALAAFKKTYGPADGQRVFDATIVKRKRREKRVPPRGVNRR
jgi:hypothetical protein